MKLVSIERVVKVLFRKVYIVEIVDILKIECIDPHHNIIVFNSGRAYEIKHEDIQKILLKSNFTDEIY